MIDGPTLNARRTAAEEITVYKLVGTDIEDMAAAELLVAQDPS